MPPQSTETETEKTPPEELKIRGFTIPYNINALNSLLDRGNLGSNSMNSLAKGYMNLGSDVTEKQYAMFRSICPKTLLPCQLLTDMKKKYGLEGDYNNAITIVHDSADFMRYCQNLENSKRVRMLNRGDPEWPGSFKPTQDFQEQVSVADQKVVTSAMPGSSSGTTTAPATTSIRRTSRQRASTVFRPLRHSTLHLPMPKADSSQSEGSQDSADRDDFADGRDTPYRPQGRDRLSDAEDESVVNTALALLLKEVTSLVNNSGKSTWSGQSAKSTTLRLSHKPVTER